MTKSDYIDIKGYIRNLTAFSREMQEVENRFERIKTRLNCEQSNETFNK